MGNIWDDIDGYDISNLLWRHRQKEKKRNCFRYIASPQLCFEHSIWISINMAPLSFFNTLLVLILAVIVFNVCADNDHQRNRRDWDFSTCAIMNDGSSGAKVARGACISSCKFIWCIIAISWKFNDGNQKAISRKFVSMSHNEDKRSFSLFHWALFLYDLARHLCPSLN